MTRSYLPPNVTHFHSRQPSLEELENARLWLQMALPAVEVLISKRRDRDLDAVELEHWSKVLAGPRDE